MKQSDISLTYYAMDSKDIEAYIKIGGYHGLKTALGMDKSEVVKEVQDANLRGRGGAGFPTGKKWAGVPPNEETYVVCNADEGEPGTFKDRYIMENIPFILLEGMTIAGYAVGAAKGYIYIRGEYPKVTNILKKALEKARSQNMLGNNILGSEFSFDIEIKRIDFFDKYQYMVMVIPPKYSISEVPY